MHRIEILLYTLFSMAYYKNIDYCRGNSLNIKCGGMNADIFYFPWLIIRILTSVEGTVQMPNAEA